MKERVKSVTSAYSNWIIIFSALLIILGFLLFTLRYQFFSFFCLFLAAIGSLIVTFTDLKQYEGGVEDGE